MNKTQTNTGKKRSWVISSRWLVMPGTPLPAHPHPAALALGGAPGATALASGTTAAGLEAPIRSGESSTVSRFGGNPAASQGDAGRVINLALVPIGMAVH